MKKLLSVLLVVVMLLPLSACNGEEKVTIYIPESVTVYTQNAAVSDLTAEYINVTMEYIFEEGWQDRESFTVIYRDAGYFINASGLSVIYGDKCEISEHKGTAKTTTYYDENGRVIRRINEYEYVINDMEKQEITYTYDENGRKLTESSKTYYTGQEEPVELTGRYTYQETEQGSEGTVTLGDTTETYYYDKQYRVVRITHSSNEGELSNSEREYDRYGNLISNTTYLNGELVSKTTTTYKSVQVSQETAARLPQFNKKTKESLFGFFG